MWLIYALNQIPDLSLIKYQSSKDDSIDSAVHQCDIFLRQWSKISAIYHISIHLWISFFPNKSNGERICINIAIEYYEANLTPKLKNLMNNSPLNDFFHLELRDEGEIYAIRSRYKYKFVLKKCERKRECVAKEQNETIPLYYVETWKANSDSRLINLLKNMSAMNEEVSYHIVLVGYDSYDSLYSSLEKPINFLRNKTINRSAQEIILKKDEFHRGSSRDIVAEETLKVYEEFLKKVSSNPCFCANIEILSNDNIVGNMLINIVCGEVINEGNWDIIEKTNKDGFSITESYHKYNSFLPETLSYWSTFYTFDEISPFFRLPALYESEHIDIKKETEPKRILGEIYLGVNQNSYEINLPQKILTKHAFVCGVPGSGKTNTMLHLCYSLWSKCRIPFLVLEPAKKEYRALANTDIEELLIFSPSSGSKFPLAINPFEFPKGLSLAEHIQNLMDVFEGAFPLTPPLPALLDRSIEGIYIEHGWDTDDINDGEKSYPTISELYQRLEYELEHTSYDGEVRGNMKSALEMRIGSLLRRDLGNVFDVPLSTIEPEDILKYPIVIELESMGTGPSNFVTLMLCTLIREVLKTNPLAQSEKNVRHVLFIEEAHNLIAAKTEDLSSDEANPKVAATNYIVKMLAEVRALREGIVIADQLPTAMASEVLKNTNLKIVHRLTSQDDRGLIGSTMSANEQQLEELATYLPGNTLLSYEGLLKPFRMQVAAFEKKDAPSTEKLYELMRRRENFSNFANWTFSIRFNKLKEKWKNEWNIAFTIYEKLISDCSTLNQTISEDIQSNIEDIVKDQVGLDECVKCMNKIIKKYKYTLSLAENADDNDRNYLNYMESQINGLIVNIKLIISKAKI